MPPAAVDPDVFITAVFYSLTVVLAIGGVAFGWHEWRREQVEADVRRRQLEPVAAGPDRQPARPAKPPTIAP